MKKILFVMLLTFSTLAISHDGRFSLIKDQLPGYGIWILDSENGELKYCFLVARKLKREGSEVRCRVSVDYEKDLKY